MLRVRRFEEQLLALLKAGELVGSAHLCIGQEAVPVGACSALLPRDAVVATYRGHGWAIARGAPLTPCSQRSSGVTPSSAAAAAARPT